MSNTFRFTQQHVVSTLQLKVDEGYIRHELRIRMARALAHHLLEHPTLGIQEKQWDFSTEFRMTVNVLTDEELHQLIEERAMEINRSHSLMNMKGNIG